jgi:hypothetical protein
MKRLIILLVCLTIAETGFSQEMNKKVFDEKNNTDILIGYCNESGLMAGEFGNSYSQEFPNYHPDNDAMNVLKYKLDDITFIVVLGTWCGDSKEQVPRFMKLMYCLKYDLNRVTFIAVDRTKTAGEVPTADYKIEKVPTFIVKRNTVEIGRIIETPEVSIEKDLIKILGL